MKRTAFFALMLMSVVAVQARFLSGHVLYLVTDPARATAEVSAIGTDLNPWTGPLNIPYNVSRGTHNYKVTAIGSQAFLSQSVTSLTVPPSCRTIGVGAFRWCDSMTELTIVRGTKFIEETAFEGCNSLTTVTLPPSIKLVGKQAFAQCAQLREIVLGEDLETLGEAALGRCPALEKVTFAGNRLVAVPDECFYDNGSMLSVAIPQNARSIGTRAFRYCVKLTTVSWGRVNAIGSEAFAMCGSLKDIWSATAVPPKAAPDAFDSRAFTEVTLHVPAGAAAAYRKAPVWSRFANIVED